MTAPMRLAAKKPEDHVAPAEPAQSQSQHGGEPDVAESDQPGADHEHAVEEHEPGHSADHTNQEVVPLPGRPGRHRQEGRDRDGKWPHNDLGQEQSLDVDHRQGKEPGEEDQEGWEVPVGAEAGGRAGEEGGAGELDERVARRNRLMAVPTLAPQKKPGHHRNVVALLELGSAGRAERARRHHGEAAGHPIDDHIEKRPDRESQERAEADQIAERHEAKGSARSPWPTTLLAGKREAVVLCVDNMPTWCRSLERLSWTENDLLRSAQREAMPRICHRQGSPQALRPSSD